MWKINGSFKLIAYSGNKAWQPNVHFTNKKYSFPFKDDGHYMVIVKD